MLLIYLYSLIIRLFIFGSLAFLKYEKLFEIFKFSLHLCRKDPSGLALLFQPVLALWGD
jgi:hypothetical protein